MFRFKINKLLPKKIKAVKEAYYQNIQAKYDKREQLQQQKIQKDKDLQLTLKSSQNNKAQKISTKSSKIAKLQNSESLPSKQFTINLQNVEGSFKKRRNTQTLQIQTLNLQKQSTNNQSQENIQSLQHLSNSSDNLKMEEEERKSPLIQSPRTPTQKIEKEVKKKSIKQKRNVINQQLKPRFTNNTDQKQSSCEIKRLGIADEFITLNQIIEEEPQNDEQAQDIDMSNLSEMDKEEKLKTPVNDEEEF